VKAEMRRTIAVTRMAGTAWHSLPVAAAQTPSALLTRRALGKIEHLQQQGYDVASVLLDLPADRVFAKISAMVHANPAVRVVAADTAKRRLDLSEGDRNGSLTVAALGDNLSQLLIVANVIPGQDSVTSRVVETVLRVCRELHRQCSAPG
jgi:hypothetical protein